MKKYNNLEKIRRSAGFTQIGLAKCLGVSKQYIWDIENGRRELSYKLAYKISVILKTTPDKIFLDDFRKNTN